LPADLVITGGRLVDSTLGIDKAGTVAVTDERVVAERTGNRVIDASGFVVAPGLVDLHVHVYWGVSHYGIEADPSCLSRGVTTAIDAGSAGARTFPGFRRYVVDSVRTRVLAFVNVAVEGMISPLVGELEDIRWASAAEAVECARHDQDVVVGVKVRLGYQMVGQDPESALAEARAAADALDLPLMVHIIDLPRPIGWLLHRLGAGDIVTHCFHGQLGGTILGEDGRLLPEVAAARRRGIVFDTGHGIGSFAWRVARAATAQDFWPDTISSDVHAYNVRGPVFDLPTTLSKMLHLGMPLAEVVRAASARPAEAVGWADRIGSLAPGRVADATVLEIRAGTWPLTDGAGETVVVDELLVPRWVVRAGGVYLCESPVPDLLASMAAGARGLELQPLNPTRGGRSS
jgi:dihydroorotase